MGWGGGEEQGTLVRTSFGDYNTHLHLGKLGVVVGRDLNGLKKENGRKSV